MEIRFWGVRGSLPTPGPDTAQFGGNTPCVEVHIEGEPLIVLDAGTGIRKLGMDVASKRKVEDIVILFSHTHWDHIQGLPFFVPLFIPKYNINLYGPVHYSKNLEEILSLQMEYTYFPVRVAELAANMTFHDLTEQELELGDNIQVRTKLVNHPVICLAYRITHNGKSMVYMTDHEPYWNLFADGDDTDREEGELVAEEQNLALVEFVDGADILIIDTQYTADEYETRIGWGHSPTVASYKLAKEAGVKEMIMFHHDPDRTDGELQQVLKDLQDEVWDPESRAVPVRLAREGLSIKL